MASAIAQAGVGPPIVDTGGPYSVNEGTELTLDGSGSIVFAGMGTYAWNFGDGGTGTGETTTHTYLDGPALNVVFLTITDEQGNASTGQTTAEVFNVAPMIDAIVDQVVASGGFVNLNVTFDDPGVLDAPWSWGIDWGDGSPSSTGSATVMSFSASHMYTGAVGDMYTATVSVEDKDGGRNSISFKTTIVSSVPEPGTLALIGLGLFGLGLQRRRRAA